MIIENKEIMSKSAVFRLKLSFPNVSGLALKITSSLKLLQGLCMP